MAPLLGPCVVLGSSPFDCCSRPPDPALHARSKVWVLAYCRGRSRNRVSSCTLHAMHALILAPFLLGAPAMEQKEFENPGIVEVRAPGGDLTVRARRGTALLPGLGEVEQVYAYEVRRGTAFPRESSATATLGLMPPIISVDRGSTLGILFRNDLSTADVAGKLQPTESNLHTHGLLVSRFDSVGWSFPATSAVDRKTPAHRIEPAHARPARVLEGDGR